MYIYLLIIFLLLLSADFRNGAITLIGSLLVFTPCIIIGVIYAIPYSLYMALKQKNVIVLFNIWLKAFKGTGTFVGELLTSIAIK